MPAMAVTAGLKRSRCPTCSTRPVSRTALTMVRINSSTSSGNTSKSPRPNLDLILAVRVVPSLDAAIAHINHYGSHHTDAILTTNHMHAQRFLREVDSASVMVNASTRFADGFEYGLGAEIGISTDKLHARGPVGLEGLTSQKYVVFGSGQLRGRPAVPAGQQHRILGHPRAQRSARAAHEQHAA